MKKTIALLLTTMTALMPLAGCTSANKKAEAGKVKLMLGLPGGDGLTDKRIVDNFIELNNERYDITTDESSWGDFVQKVKLQLVAKNEITPVFFTDSEQAISFGGQGALEPLNSYVEKLDASLYNSSLTCLKDAEGNLWGVPHALNSVAIVYNKDIFDEKGVEYPKDDWTWEEMLQMAEKLTFDRDGDGDIDVYGIFYSANDTQGWRNFTNAYGVSTVKDNYRNSNLNDPKVLEAMKAYQEPVLKGIVPHPAEIAAQGNAETVFANEKLAMYLCQANGLSAINKFNPELNYDAQIMPIGWDGDRKCIFVPNSWVISKDIEQNVKDAAWEWIAYYLSEEAQLIVAEKTLGGYPVMKKALEAVTNNGQKPEHKDAFYRGIDQWGTIQEENICSSNITPIINNMVSKIRSGEDIQTNIDAAHKELQDTLDYFYDQL